MPYSDEEFAEIVRVLKRRKSCPVIDKTLLRQRLEEIVQPFGPIPEADKERAQAWHDLQLQDLTAKDLAGKLDRLARAADQVAAVLSVSDVRASVNGLAVDEIASRQQQKRPGLRERSESGVFLKEFLNDLAVVKRCAEVAVAYHRRLVVRGRPPNDLVLDAAIVALADLYCELLGLLRDHRTVPYSPSSHFVGFVDAVLRPILPARKGVAENEGISPRSVSKRWKRLRESRHVGRRTTEKRTPK